MRVLNLLLVVFFGGLGAVALLRSLERLVLGHGLLPVQLVIGVVGLGLAWLNFTAFRQRGRRADTAPDSSEA
ncbi:MAG: hypothetical protein AAF533_19255 [Acidobacteriota bacterium]